MHRLVGAYRRSRRTKLLASLKLEVVCSHVESRSPRLDTDLPGELWCCAAVDHRASELSPPRQQRHFYTTHHTAAFRPIADAAYHNSLRARSADVRSPGRNWTLAAYDDDDDEMGWTSDRSDKEPRRGRPPAYSPQPAEGFYRRRAPVSPAPPILRPDNYTLKRAPRDAAGPAAAAFRGAVDPADTDGHLSLGYLDEEAATTAGDAATDSGYSLQRSTAPPSPAPLDIV